jgi:hypothetical protein
MQIDWWSKNPEEKAVELQAFVAANPNVRLTTSMPLCSCVQQIPRRLTTKCAANCLGFCDTRPNTSPTKNCYEAFFNAKGASINAQRDIPVDSGETPGRSPFRAKSNAARLDQAKAKGVHSIGSICGVSPSRIIMLVTTLPDLFALWLYRMVPQDLFGDRANGAGTPDAPVPRFVPALGTNFWNIPSRLVARRNHACA